MKILCISDHVEPMLHGPKLTSYAEGVEAVISCGDLPFDYLEYIITCLGVPLYYVLGNHDPASDGPEHPEGCTPLDGRVVDAEGMVLVGLSGSRLYSGGPNQYTERQMRGRAWALSISILARKLAGAADLRQPRPTLRPRRPRGSRAHRLRVVPGAHRPPQALPVVARARAPVRTGRTEGRAQRRDQDRKRLRAPAPGSVELVAGRGGL